MNFATPLIVLNPQSPEQKIFQIWWKKFMYLEIIFFNVHCQIFAGYTLILFKTFYNWGMVKSILYCCFSSFCIGSYEVKTVEIFYLSKQMSEICVVEDEKHFKNHQKNALLTIFSSILQIHDIWYIAEKLGNLPRVKNLN